MIKAFKEFWTDYWKVCKESMKWMKKHWIGYIILCIVVFAITVIPLWIENRRNQKMIDKIREQNTVRIDF